MGDAQYPDLELPFLLISLNPNDIYLSLSHTYIYIHISSSSQLSHCHELLPTTTEPQLLLILHQLSRLSLFPPPRPPAP